MRAGYNREPCRLMPNTPTQAELIRRAIQAHMEELHTAMPVRVISYNSSRETVDLVPQFGRSLKNDPQATDPFTLEDLPTFPDVPVAWASGGGGSHFITFPLAKNDTGFVIFCERDLGVWRSTGQPGTTGDQRTHSLAGGIFVPALRPNKEKLGSGKVGSKLTIGSEVFLGSTGAAEALVKGSTFMANYNGHSHISGGSGSPSGPPVPLMTAADLSTKHKLDS